ncbi:MAG: hypothetical protein Tsb0034_17560 [Ekhidna sp.]
MVRSFTFILLFVSSITSFSQEADTAQYAEVRNLVAFYEYMLNTVGANKSYTRDKEVVIRESYKKIFQSGDVQIEDDLMDDRTVITNKDVTAYLRDVDFFFQDIRFDFSDIIISHSERPNGEKYFLAEFESSINGITLEGNPYKRNGKRFLEVNINEQDSDLKIVSIYSTKMSREKELINWWNSLSFGWISIFEKLVPFDSINNEVLLKIASIDSLDLSGNQFILDLEPLSALKDLVYLDISDSKIDELNAIRYAAQLKGLKANNTLIKDISVLQYFEGLKELEIANTAVTDITVLTKTKSLVSLNLSNTQPGSFEALSHLKNLKTLNLSGTPVTSLAVLGKIEIENLDVSQTPLSTTAYFTNIPALKSVNLSETQITDLKGLKGHPTIECIAINKTVISDLSPLEENVALRKVYADFTSIKKEQAASFMAGKPQVVVVTNSQELETWWTALSGKWKSTLSAAFGKEPKTKEELVRLINIDSLSLADQGLSNSSPLINFGRLNYLDISGNSFANLDFLEEITSLKTLKAESIPTIEISGVRYASGLEWISFKNTHIDTIEPLYTLNKLSYLDLSSSNILEIDIKSLLDVNAEIVVIYNTSALVVWYDTLSIDWKGQFSLENVDAISLHRLTQSRTLTINHAPISSLKPLQAFINLRDITLVNVRLSSLSELSTHTKLESITYENGPLRTLEGIANLKNLKHLDVSNTAIEDLRPIETMVSLQKLDCSGTSIKNFKGISKLVNLEEIDASNTRVWKLTRLYGLNKLKKLICYNTRLSQPDIDDFKVTFKDCEITFY